MCKKDARIKKIANTHVKYPFAAPTLTRLDCQRLARCCALVSKFFFRTIREAHNSIIFHFYYNSA